MEIPIQPPQQAFIQSTSESLRFGGVPISDTTECTETACTSHTYSFQVGPREAGKKVSLNLESPEFLDLRLHDTPPTLNSTKIEYALPEGTYYVQVANFSNEFVPGTHVYTLTLSTEAPPPINTSTFIRPNETLRKGDLLTVTTTITNETATSGLVTTTFNIGPEFNRVGSHEFVLDIPISQTTTLTMPLRIDDVPVGQDSIIISIRYDTENWSIGHNLHPDIRPYQIFVPLIMRNFDSDSPRLAQPVQACLVFGANSPGIRAEEDMEGNMRAWAEMCERMGIDPDKTIIAGAGPIDIDQDGITDPIETILTANDLRAQLLLIAEQNPDKTILYNFVGHGTQGYSFQISPDNSITDTELDAIFDECEERFGVKVIFNIDSCHSGSLIESLKDSDRVIVTSTSKDNAWTDPTFGTVFVNELIISNGDTGQAFIRAAEIVFENNNRQKASFIVYMGESFTYPGEISNELISALSAAFHFGQEVGNLQSPNISVTTTTEQRETLANQVGKAIMNTKKTRPDKYSVDLSQPTLSEQIDIVTTELAQLDTELGRLRYNPSPRSRDRIRKEVNQMIYTLLLEKYELIQRKLDLHTLPELERNRLEDELHDIGIQLEAQQIYIQTSLNN